MHLQTGGSRASIMSYSTVPIPASPTLTNPDMILPYVEYDSASPGGNYRSACPGEERADIRQIDTHFSIAPPRTNIALTTPIIYGNGTMLSDIGEVTEAESTPGRSKLPGPAERRMLKQKQASGNYAPVGSSPTHGYAAVMKRTRVGTHQRTISIESSSTVTSDGQAAEMFKDFDDGVSVDDSVFQGDDEESVADSYSEQVIASETQRLAMADNQLEHEDDRNSSAALSRRAEQILLNAKKRLTVGLHIHLDPSLLTLIQNMEDNLTRARSSLCATPSGSISSIHSSSPLSRSTPSPLENDRIAGAFSMYPSRQRLLPTPAESPAASPTNPRVGSENSILLPQRMAPFPIPIPVRSVNTAARFTGRSDGGKRSPTLSQAPQAHCEDTRTIAHSGFFSSLSKGFPPLDILQPLTEDDGIVDFDADRESIRSSVDGYLRPNGEHRGLTRSVSSMQMRDLKDQMSDLKGRLSVLRDRARSDTMKRRSLQSLRTPSPFTAAEQWYATSNNYGDPLSVNAGVASPPWKVSQSGDNEARQVQEAIDGTSEQVLCVEDAALDITSVYEDINEHSGTFALEDENESRSSETAEEIYRIVQEHQQNEEAGEGYEEVVGYKEADHYESDTSVYHDSLSTQLSHEDREDAFDYEHFFLHSAMGTICQQKLERRCSSGSASSEDSVETVQATPAYKEPITSIRGRVRSESIDSLSSLATFATATEGLQSEHGDEEEPDIFAVQQLAKIIPRSNTTTPLAAKRSTFGGAEVNGQIDDIQPFFDKKKLPGSTGNDKIRRNGLQHQRPSVDSFKSFGFNGTLKNPPLVSTPELQQSKSSALEFRASKEIEPSLLSDSTTLTDDTNGEHLQSSPIHMLAREDRILVQRIVASLGKCVLGLQEAGSASYEGGVWRRKIDNARRQLENEETGI
ncbi:hypothetical protein QTJ16_003793 [Diplocarpon rosae]|uniref:Uncharacterized protein n=1 Tax=Diplocarpon rosae TaxID=946125 RepID=A0AAD9SY02_9HELO|nr:hypothetical protein QTJ16_003793 [Diplocarpon rosae]PBP28348.1 hypothetical protein BUE80_DR000635 [Diplocarpon rosae]